MSARSSLLRPWHGVFFVLMLLASAVLLAPPAAVLRQAPGRLTYASATGTVWNGTLVEARLGPLRLERVSWRVRPEALLGGALAVDVTMAGDAAGQAALTLGPEGVRRLSAPSLTVEARALPALAGAARLSGTTRFDGLDLVFRDGQCQSAAGAQQSDVLQRSGAGLIGRAGPALKGVASCGGAEAWIPLEAEDKRVRAILSLHPGGDARWQVDVVPDSVETGSALAVAGFRPVADEPQVRYEEAFRWLP